MHSGVRSSEEFQLLSMLLKHGADNAIPLSPEVLKNHQPMVKKGETFRIYSSIRMHSRTVWENTRRGFQALQKMNGQWIH